MHLTLILSTLFLLAQAQYDYRSPDFSLLVLSANETINGTILAACHEGAAIDGLCYTSITLDDAPSPYTIFYHNTSSSITTDPDNIADLPGPVSYSWTLGGPDESSTVESTLRFSVNPSSNVAIPLFFPDQVDYQVFYFDSCDSMYIQRPYDDTVSPIAIPSDQIRDFNWYLCETYYGYRFDTLAWKVGAFGTPQNPTCVGVMVKRVFIDEGDTGFKMAKMDAEMAKRCAARGLVFG